MKLPAQKNTGLVAAIVAFFVSVTTLSLTLLASSQAKSNAQEAARKLVVDFGYSLQSRVRDASAPLAALKLAVAVKTLSREDIDERAHILLDQYASSVDSLALAPDGRISRGYPAASAGGLIGTDLLADPRYAEGAALAGNTGETILTGPFPGQGSERRFYLIMPVLRKAETGGRSWGFLLAGVDLSTLLGDLPLRLFSSRRLDYAIWLKDHHGRAVRLDGDDPIALRDFVVESVATEGLRWYASVRPKDGWIPWTLPAVGCALSLALGVGAFSILRELLDRPLALQAQVDAATEALRERMLDLEIAQDELARTAGFLSYIYDGLEARVRVGALDPDGRYYWVHNNLADRTVTGQDFCGESGKTFAESPGSRCVADFAPECLAAIRRGERFTAETSVRRLDETRWFLTTCTPVPGTNGFDSLVIETSLDITALKLEQEKNERLVRAALVRENRLLRAEQLSSYGHLTSAIAHELRQPLSVIRILVDGVLYWDEEGKPLPYARIISDLLEVSNAVVRVDSIIQSMRELYVARDEIRLEPRDLNELIGKSSALWGRKLADNGIKMEFDLAKNLPPVTLSEPQFHQAMIRLVSDAAENLTRTLQERRISIATSYTGQAVVLSFRLSGPDLSDAELESIFDPWPQTRDKDDENGRDIGLYVVRNIFKAFGAEIDAGNHPQGGRVLTINFKP